MRGRAGAGWPKPESRSFAFELRENLIRCQLSHGLEIPRTAQSPAMDVADGAHAGRHRDLQGTPDATNRMASTSAKPGQVASPRPASLDQPAFVSLRQFACQQQKDDVAERALARELLMG